MSGRNALVTCSDLNANDCRPTVDVIPSSKTDFAERLEDLTTKAKQLRRGYAPILDALAAAPLSVDRSAIPIVWTLSIVDAGEMTFDPANSVIPFPNDVLRTGPKGTVALPNLRTGRPLTAADCQTTDTSIQLVCGLNTLDGFSTLVSPISENSDTAGALEQGTIDAKSLDARTVGLVALKSDAPSAERTTPKCTPCLNCLSSRDEAGNEAVAPQQLHWMLRGGVLVDPSPSPASTLTPDIPDSTRVNLAVGGTYKSERGFHVDVGYQLIVVTSKTSTAPQFPGEYGGFVNILGLSLGYTTPRGREGRVAPPPEPITKGMAAPPRTAPPL